MFKRCLGLLKNTTAISKTKKKKAHRAYGQGEPEINADGVHEGSSSPQTEIVHGNVSVSTSREDSVIHHKNCIQESCKNSSSGGIVNQHVKDLEKERIKANKLSMLDSKVR
ncbi:hypothetical protein H0E87_000523 [Populus deltoides]|uniref:Uncharacterized protein n=1 Tax=Populus deltoides TaxID=3696 RepID=A0A8T2ZN09_POPDE|nr:hypothetical protein H0E87_000523 [Populus deltoides]